VETPETRYARTEDGFHIAYRVAGDGPVDLVYIPGWFSNVDLMWDEPGMAPGSSPYPGSSDRYSSCGCQLAAARSSSTLSDTPAMKPETVSGSG